MCADVEPLLCRRLVGPCSLLGLLSPASRAPDLSWDSRRAFQKSPPNELDSVCHQARQSSITTSSTLARQHHLHRRHPAHERSSCVGSRRFFSRSLYRSRCARRMRGIVHGTFIAKRVETIIQRIRRMCFIQFGQQRVS